VARNPEESGGVVNCEHAGEYISALCDGEKIPQAAALHIGACKTCQLELSDYATMGAELRRLASLDEANPIPHPVRHLKPRKIAWWQRGLTTMKIPKLAFGVMVIAIVALSSGLVMVRARAGAAARFLQLEYKVPPPGSTHICVMRADGSEKDNLCNFSSHGQAGLLLMNTRIIANSADHVELAIRAKYIPGAGDVEVNYTDALFKDVPENRISFEPGERQKIQVLGLGAIEVEGKYLDHIPALAYRPQETLDPNLNEFRVVAPVLVRDNEVVVNGGPGSSIETGAPDATLMLYGPGEGRYLISLVPFEGAAEGDVHLGQITFSLEGHDYLLLTSMPITVAEHVWIKHEPDFKPSERMIRISDARDDRAMFLVRSLKTLEQQRIPH
jgi:hypothetical protein